MFKKLLNWFANLFVRDNTDPDDPFPEFDEQRISIQLDIENEAQRQGVANVPHESDSGLGGTEELIKSEFTQRYSRCHQKTIERIAALKTELLAVDFDEYIENLNFKPEKIEADFEKIYQQGQTEVKQLQIEVDTLQQNFDTFQQQNRLTHFPSYPATRILPIGILCMIVVVETLMNGYFFAKGSEFGLLGGVLQAFIISSVNVLVAYVVGNFVFRWIFHRNVWIKTSGFIFFTLYILFLAVFVLAITHFRDAFTVDPDNAWGMASVKLKSLSFDFLDFESYLFLAFSLIFALFALMDAFHMDDYYPRHGKLHRRLQSAKEALSEEKEERSDELEEKIISVEGEIEYLKESVAERKANMNQAEQAINVLIDTYRKYMKSLEQGGIALIKEFQQNNKIHRTSAPPKYFMEKPDLPFDEFELTEQEIPDFQTELEKLETFHQDLERQLLNVTQLSTKYLSDFAGNHGHEA